MLGSKPLDALHVFLTGASAGVGEAILQQISARGARVFATSRTQSKLDEATKQVVDRGGADVHAVASDLTSLAEVESVANAALEWFDSRIDVVINNAGIGYHGPASTIRGHETTEVMAVNAIAPMMLIRHFLPALRRSAAPKIINVSSILGSKPMPLTSTYTASKHALNGFSKVLRLEEAASNISVTLIEPGAVETAFIQRTHDPDALKKFRGQQVEQLAPVEVARWVVAVMESAPSVCPELVRITPMSQAI